MKPWLLDEFQMPLNMWILKVTEYELLLNTAIGCYAIESYSGYLVFSNSLKEVYR